MPIDSQRPPLGPPASFQLSAAEAFVLASGTPRQVAYWKAAFGWGPVEVWLFEVEHLQGPGGGWGEGAESLAGTAAMLRWLAGVNLGEDVFEVGPRMFAYLEGAQQPDGAWGDLDTTRAIAAYLAYMGELPEAVARAAAFVFDQPAPADPVACALGLGLARAQGHAAYAEACLAGLQALPADTATLAWVHEGLIQAGINSQDPLRARIHAALAGRQRPDGSFEGDAETTFFASRVLVSR